MKPLPPFTIGWNRSVDQSITGWSRFWLLGSTSIGPSTVRIAAGWSGTTGCGVAFSPSTSTSANGSSVARRSHGPGHGGTRSAASSRTRMQNAVTAPAASRPSSSVVQSIIRPGVRNPLQPGR